jgi:hypothetical protein
MNVLYLTLHQIDCRSSGDLRNNWGYWVHAVVGKVPTKRSSDHDPMIRHCQIIGRFEP